MSDTETKTSKAPTHSVYHVRDNPSGKSFWTRIGAAWAHTDSQGFNVQVECVPLDGRLTLRVVTEAKE